MTRPVKAAPARATPPAKAAPRRPEPPVITSLDDFEESVKICIFGDPGAGKTPLAATLPNALIVALETDGPISAKRWGSTAKVTVCKTFADFRKVVLWVRDVAGPRGDFEWIIIDSATKMQEKDLKSILLKAHADNPLQSPDIPSKREHQIWQYEFKKYVNMVNDLPVNVAWLAHAMYADLGDFQEDETASSRLVLPMLSGKNGTQDPKTMSLWFSGTIGLLAYLEVNDEVEEGTGRRLVVKRTGDYIDCLVKDRFDLGVDYFDNPNMADIAQLIQNSGVRAPGNTQKRGR